MAIITQSSLFAWDDIEELGDLKRLKLVLDAIPDEDLMCVLERERGNGRDDYPVRAVWNSLLAGVVFQHDSVESLRRELCRNAQLRQLCGFKIYKGGDSVPSSYSYSRFMRTLFDHVDLIEKIFDDLVKSFSSELEGFGSVLAIDSKEIKSRANGRGRKSGADQQPPDGRRETDAEWGKKEYRGVDENGSAWEKIHSWFGFKLHLLVDAEYELPVGYEVTKAKIHDLPAGRELFAETAEKHPKLAENCRYLVADRAYDDGSFIKKLWDGYEIKPVVDIRNLWRSNDDPTRLVSGSENVVYDYRGTVQCYCMETGEVRRMPYGGYEYDRGTLKYRCPAKHYGIKCRYYRRCRHRNSIRIKLDEDRRVFTPLARSSQSWDKIYAKRSAVERVNSRIGEQYRFEKHYIRGLKKMKTRMGIAMIVMLSMALGHIREGRMDRIRSLVRCA